MTDAIREGLLLLPHDLTAGETAIDAEHSLACRRCSALAALDELREQRDEWMAPFDGSGAEWHESLPNPYTYKASDFSALVAAVHEYESQVLELREQMRQAELLAELNGKSASHFSDVLQAAEARADRAEQENRQMTKALENALRRAPDEPIGVDISDYNDDFCRGFLAGQESILEEIIRDPAALAAAEEPR